MLETPVESIIEQLDVLKGITKSVLMKIKCTFLQGLLFYHVSKVIK